MDREELRELARLWDGLAAPYVEHLYDELDHKPRDRELLARVAELAKPLKPAAERAAAASTQPATAERGEAASLFSQGVAALDAGKREEARALWEQALAKDPDNWLIRKQVWTLEAPEAFWSGAEIDYGWQKRRMAEKR